MRGYRVFLVLTLFFIALAGCSKKDYTKEPAKMHWDRDMCARCKMAISERKFAVQGVDTKGKVYKFDDLGCLVMWQAKEHPEVKFAKIWITDSKTGEWIDARKAYYQKGCITPMGYGFCAYKDKPTKGPVYTYEEVKELIKKMKR